jgi:hypothetical protein
MIPREFSPPPFSGGLTPIKGEEVIFDINREPYITTIEFKDNVKYF